MSVLRTPRLLRLGAEIMASEAQHYTVLARRPIPAKSGGQFRMRSWSEVSDCW